MCILLYGSHSSITYTNDGYTHLATGDFCSWAKIPSVRLRKHLEICQDMDMIEDLKLYHGLAIFKIIRPDSFQ
jgi:hypothetical protein